MDLKEHKLYEMGTGYVIHDGNELHEASLCVTKGIITFMSLCVVSLPMIY